MIKPVHRICAYLSLHGGTLIAIGANLECCERFARHDVVPHHLQEIRNSLDAMERALAAYEATLLGKPMGEEPPASAAEDFAEIVRIVDPPPGPDEHQSEINAGAVSFAAFRDARGAV